MKQQLHFTKMQGLKNDFVVLDGLTQRLDHLEFSLLAQKLCHRRLGIGADGLIVIAESSQSDIKMIFYNADGSEAEICGNGIRCLARFVYEKKIIEKDVFSLETKAGVKVPALLLDQGLFKAVEVDMGTAKIEERLNLNYESKEIKVHSINMGNPHAVVFVEHLDVFDIEHLGPFLQRFFPKGVNVELVQIDQPHHAKVRVWERGVGRSQACGTGACAVLVAGHDQGLLNTQAEIELEGGSLNIEWQGSGKKVIMTGPAEHIFDGQLYL